MARERVRRETELGPGFAIDALDRAMLGFRELYNEPPLRVLCAPDVLLRWFDLRGRPQDALSHGARPAHAGVPLEAAVLAPGTVAVEGDVDDVGMGDW